MPLITTSFPNLTGGVSQQPASQRLLNQCETQENALPLLVGGLIKRPPTNHIAELKTTGGASLDLSSAFTHFVIRDKDEEFVVSLTGVGNTVHVHDLAGNPKTVYYDLGSTPTYLTSGTPEASFKAISIADVTFLVNTAVSTAMSTDVSTYSRGQATAQYEALIWIKSTQQGADYTVKTEIDGEAEQTAGTCLHTPEADNIGGGDVYAYPPDPPSTTAIAAALAVGTAVTDCTVQPSGIDNLTNFTSTSKGSVVWVQNTDEDFQITVEDSFGQQGHKLIKDSVQEFSELPPIAKNGFKVLIKGDPESEVDDYYVKFETNGDEDFGAGIWLEDMGPGLEYAWNYQTMPHLLIRQSDGTFMVKQADGVTPGSDVPVGESYSSFKFIPRQVGDDNTNPLPSFVTKKINDISFFKSRLAILSGEDCALSETAELFNFFRTTTTMFPDTAPIDVGAGGTEVNKLEEAVPFSDRLLLFSNRSQFSLQGEATLSPLTASVTQATNFDISTTVSPITVGNSMFFAFSRGSFSGIREFYKTEQATIDFDAIESTAQCPRYISGTVEKMTASTHEDMLAVLSAGTSTDLYMYKFYKTERGRVQSAWFKFILPGSDILDIHFIGQSLYLLIKRGTKTFLERMDLQTGLTDTGKDYVTMVDRRSLITPGSGGAATNTITLTYDITDGDTMQVVSTDGEIMTVASTTTNTIVLSEDFTATDSFYVGIPYTMKYELSKPVLKRPKQDGGYEMVAVGRHQLRYMTIVYSETAMFKVKITPIIGSGEGTTIEYPFSGRFLSAGGFLGAVPSETGDFRFPVFAESDSVSIIIENDSPLPSNLQSIEFEANYTSRSQPRFS